jgi:hypothetical protein
MSNRLKDSLLHTLVTTLKKGLNDDEIGEVIEYAFSLTISALTYRRVNRPTNAETPSTVTVRINDSVAPNGQSRTARN